MYLKSPLVIQAPWDPDFQDHYLQFPNDVKQFKHATCSVEDT